MIQLLQLEEVLEWMRKSYKAIANNSENLWDFEYESLPSRNYRLFHLDLYSNNSWYWCGDRKQLWLQIRAWNEIMYMAPKAKTNSSARSVSPSAYPKILLLGLALTPWCMELRHFVLLTYSVADGMALQGLNLIGNNLLEVYKNPDNLNARGAMLISSLSAKDFISKGLGLVH